MFISLSIKAAIHLGLNYLANVGGLREHKLRGNPELLQYHTEKINSDVTSIPEYVTVKPNTCARFWGLAMFRAESLRRLVAQLSFLTSLEAAGSGGPDPCHGACLSSRTPPPSLALPLSQPSSWLHPAQLAWSHGSFRQVLSRGLA